MLKHPVVVYSHHLMDGKHSDVHEHTDADNLIGTFTHQQLSQHTEAKQFQSRDFSKRNELPWVGIKCRYSHPRQCS